MASNGTTVLPESSVDNQIGFTGRYEDSETGLVYFRARYYSSTQGRFIGRDPIGYLGGMSFYLPYFIPNRLDPFGLSPESADCPSGAGGNPCKGGCTTVRTRPILMWNWAQYWQNGDGGKVVGYWVVPSMKDCTCGCFWLGKGQTASMNIPLVKCSRSGDNGERAEMLDRVGGNPRLGGGGVVSPRPPAGTDWVPGDERSDANGQTGLPPGPPPGYEHSNRPAPDTGDSIP